MKLAGRARERGDPRDQLADSFCAETSSAEAKAMTNSDRTRTAGASTIVASNGAAGSRMGSDAARVRPVTIFHESAGAVVMIGDRCLALRRGDEWVFPKGQLEQGERPEDAAIREVREEAGLEVRILQPIGSTRYGFGERADAAHRKRVHWFLAASDANAIRLEPPFSESLVLDREEAARVLAHAADRQVAERAFEAASEIAGGAPARGRGGRTGTR
jgi:diadenosine hexaphosphate hydrolase (ATP-forming)